MFFLHSRRRYSDDGLEPDFADLGLPPLETFVGFPDLDLDFRGPDCVSLRADSIELENDVLPSTPLTEEQLGQEEELGVPINQVLSYSLICQPHVTSTECVTDLDFSATGFLPRGQYF